MRVACLYCQSKLECLKALESCCLDREESSLFQRQRRWIECENVVCMMFCLYDVLFRGEIPAVNFVSNFVECRDN